jgi:hypothetical protein
VRSVESWAVSRLQIQTPAVKKVNRVASAIGAMTVMPARRGHALGWAGKPWIMNVASIRASVPNGSERAVGMRGEASDALAGEMLCLASEKAEEGGEQGDDKGSHSSAAAGGNEQGTS